MLTTEMIFARIMAKLEAIDPSTPLHKDLEPYLRLNMIRGPHFVRLRTLEHEGSVPKRAYYIVRGYVVVYGFDRDTNQHAFRIYGPDSFVVLNCFMKQCVSEYTIRASRDTYVWSISGKHMMAMYQCMEGIEKFALKAALDFSSEAEQRRSDLIALENKERVEAFYKFYLDLLPAKTSPIRDKDIADYLDLSVTKFRRIRWELIDEGRLPG